MLEKSFKSVKILHAETLILLSDFLQLPAKAFSCSENVQNLIMYSSLAVLMKSVSICKVLHKYITEKESSAVGYGMNMFFLLKYIVTFFIIIASYYSFLSNVIKMSFS